MTYRTEFPDFGELDVTLPEGFEDVSRYDDGMPSFVHRRLGLFLMIDYLEPSRRLVPGAGRFTLFRVEPGELAPDVGDPILETDHFAEVEDFIRRAA